MVGGGVDCAAAPEGPSWVRRGLGASSKNSTGSQFVQIWQTYAGQYVEKVGSGGTDALGGSPGAKGAAAGHDDHRTVGRGPFSLSGTGCCRCPKL